MQTGLDFFNGRLCHLDFRPEFILQSSQFCLGRLIPAFCLVHLILRSVFLFDKLQFAFIGDFLVVVICLSLFDFLGKGQFHLLQVVACPDHGGLLFLNGPHSLAVVNEGDELSLFYAVSNLDLHRFNDARGACPDLDLCTDLGLDYPCFHEYGLDIASFHLGGFQDFYFRLGKEDLVTIIGGHSENRDNDDNQGESFHGIPFRTGRNIRVFAEPLALLNRSQGLVKVLHSGLPFQ